MLKYATFYTVVFIFLYIYIFIFTLPTPTIYTVLKRLAAKVTCKYERIYRKVNNTQVKHKGLYYSYSVS